MLTALIREQVDTRATARTIEVFHPGKRVAAHARRYGGPRHGTQAEHMPSAHRRYAEWTPAGTYPDGQLRTLQRRLREWRHEMAHQLVFGAASMEEASRDGATPRAGR